MENAKRSSPAKLERRQNPAIIFVPALALLCCVGCESTSLPGARVQRQRQRQLQVEAIRVKAHQLYLALEQRRRQRLSGAPQTASPSIRWITRDQLVQVRLLEHSPLSTDTLRRTLRHLRLMLTAQALERPGVQQRLAHLLYRRKVPVSGQIIRLQQLLPLALGTGLPRVSSQLTAALDELDRALVRRQRVRRRAADELGFSLHQLLQQQQEQKTAELLGELHNSVMRTDRLFATVWRRLELPGARPISAARLLQLENGGVHAAALPASQQQPALLQLLRGLGLKLETRQGRPIRVISGARSAALFDGPDELLLVRGAGRGLRRYTELFEAAGEAICLGAVSGSRWEQAALGPRLGARVMGHLLGLVWLEPRWWKIHRAMLVQSGPTAPDAAHPGLQLALAGLLRLRLGSALLQTRLSQNDYSISVGPRPVAARGAWPTPRPSVVLDQALRRLQIPLAPGDQRLLLLRLPLWGDAVTDLRALILAHMLAGRLRKQHGPGWFASPRLGPRLLQQLCAPGSIGPRALTQRLGIGGLDHDAVQRNLTRALGEPGADQR